MITGGPALEATQAPTAANAISPARRFYWSVRRELWENRSIYLAPLVVAIVALLGFLVALVRLPDTLRAAQAAGPAQLHQAVQQPYLIVALLLMVTDLLVAIFYCLDALYGERRDRSLLFWKSLPVSDLETVAAKAAIPILVLPLIVFAVTVATQFVMLLASSAVLAASGMSAALPWTHLPYFATARIHLVHMVGFHGLLYAPFYAWLLLASAWAKRAPLLWATLPPVVIGLFERLAFGSTHFAHLVQHHFLGGSGEAEPSGGMNMDMLSSSDFLTGPAMWIGLTVAALFLFAAARLRRRRVPI